MFYRKSARQLLLGVSGKRTRFLSRRIVPIVLMLTVVFASQLAAAYASPFQVNAGPPSPIYRTDFENVTLKYPEPHNDNGLNMGIPNSLVYGNYVQPGGATAWMEGLDKKTPGFTCHSGTRCLGMELFDASKSRRDEFNIDGLKELVGDEMFLSVWLYLPADWQTHGVGSPNGWNSFEFFNPFWTAQSPYTRPYSAVDVCQATSPSPSIPFVVAVTWNDLNDVQHPLGAYQNFPLPRGRWFQAQYYVLRDPTNGILKIWIDGTLVLDKSGLQTKATSSPEEWFTTPAKIYYNTQYDTFSPYQIWVDDLEISNTLPSSTTTSPTTTSYSTTSTTTSSTITTTTTSSSTTQTSSSATSSTTTSSTSTSSSTTTSSTITTAITTTSNSTSYLVVKRRR
ncbi:MAG: hypothetical protein ABSF82_14340 [Candidatus Bathyarchaeia archaeon]